MSISSCSPLIALCGVVLFTACSPGPQKAEPQQPVIIAYVGGFRGLVNTDSINTGKVSHINYAFVDIKDNRAWLHNEATDTINLRRLSALKQRNPNLKILISIGGWTWSKNFSDATLTDTGRTALASSAVDIVARFNLDGIDIDWEYPGLPGDNNPFRPEDKYNYTLLFKALRAGLDSLQGITGRYYLVTTAVGASDAFITHTEMDKVAQYNDYINIMSYDYRGVADSVTGHHTNLYASQLDPDTLSSHRSVDAFIAAGVPPEKIVLGIAFYGKGWQVRSAANNGLYQPVAQPVHGYGFTYLHDSLVNQQGYTRYWDSAAAAPWLFNPQTNTLITYDDETSVRMKCDYIISRRLAGAMFWEYASDPEEYLLSTIAGAFGYEKEE